MGNEHRMAVTLYTSQIDEIAERIRAGQTHYAKMAFIKEKYGDVAKIFVDSYLWYAKQAELLVPREEDAESAIWAYQDLINIEEHQGSQIVPLNVPISEGVYFKMSDWFKILNFRYIGKSEAEEKGFADKLKAQGINYEGDVFMKPFYPALKKEVTQSWQNLFRFHEDVKQSLMAGREIPIDDLQVGLWKVDPTWLK